MGRKRARVARLEGGWGGVFLQREKYIVFVFFVFGPPNVYLGLVSVYLGYIVGKGSLERRQSHFVTL
jgi:hypothetical protein